MILITSLTNYQVNEKEKENSAIERPNIAWFLSIQILMNANMVHFLMNFEVRLI